MFHVFLTYIIIVITSPVKDVLSREIIKSFLSSISTSNSAGLGSEQVQYDDLLSSYRVDLMFTPFLGKGVNFLPPEDFP